MLLGLCPRGCSLTSKLALKPGLSQLVAQLPAEVQVTSMSGALVGAPKQTNSVQKSLLGRSLGQVSWGRIGEDYGT